jgi:hypothetical protein
MSTTGPADAPPQEEEDVGLYQWVSGQVAAVKQFVVTTLDGFRLDLEAGLRGAALQVADRINTMGDNMSGRCNQDADPSSDNLQVKGADLALLRALQALPDARAFEALAAAGDLVVVQTPTSSRRAVCVDAARKLVLAFGGYIPGGTPPGYIPPTGRIILAQ